MLDCVPTAHIRVTFGLSLVGVVVALSLAQYKPITAVRFVIGGTIEERILKLQVRKPGFQLERGLAVAAGQMDLVPAGIQIDAVLDGGRRRCLLWGCVGYAWHVWPDGQAG